MKRGFLFGLGSFLALAAVAGIIKALMHGGLTGIIILFVAAPLGVLTFRRAMYASTGPRLDTVIGWLIGFFFIDVLAFAVIGLAILVPLLSSR
jgi:hypothetical protein